MVVEFLAVDVFDFDVLFFADAFFVAVFLLLGVLFVATGWRADDADADAEVAPPRVRVDRLVLVVLLLMVES